MPRYSRERVWTVFVLALALCAIVTVVRHRSEKAGGNDPLTNITRRVLLSPILHAGNVITDGWQTDISSIFRGPALAREVRRLKSQNANLMQLDRSLADQATENVELRMLLSFKQHDPRDLLPAEVLALKPFADRDSAIFSRGTDNDVTIKQPALDADGNLIGQVTSVTSDTSDVMLLTDTLSSVGARVVDASQQPAAAATVALPIGSVSAGQSAATPTTPVPSNTATPAIPAAAPTQSDEASPAAVGICIGNHSNTLELTDLAPDADVQVGDTVVTSGLGGVYPKDIPIGRVIEVDFDKTRYLKSAVVAPWADFNHLQEGFLLR